MSTRPNNQIDDPGVHNVHVRACTDFTGHEIDARSDITTYGKAPGSSQ